MAFHEMSESGQSLDNRPKLSTSSEADLFRNQIFLFTLFVMHEIARQTDSNEKSHTNGWNI